MDPVTHTFTGALLARTGLKDATPLAAATLVVAANIPDVDILTYVGGEYAGLAHRRGWTHGLPAVFVWPFVVAGAFLLWDRLVRRRGDPEAAPAAGRALLLLASIGVLTHPSLDWLNTYGMRWLMPFDGSWTYGDAVFIVDPWLWLLLGGPLFLRHSRGWRGIVGWGVFWALASFLVLSAPIVPPLARALWTTWLLALLALRFRRGPEGGGAFLARASAGAAMAYVFLMIVLSAAGARRVRNAALEARIEVREVMVAPQPANPLAWGLVVTTPQAYHRGSLGWGPGARVTFDEGPLPLRMGGGTRGAAVVEAASEAPRARDFLVWSRYPYYRVEETDDGFVVRIGDARYSDVAGAGGLAGLAVRLDADLNPVLAATGG